MAGLRSEIVRECRRRECALGSFSLLEMASTQAATIVGFLFMDVTIELRGFLW